MRAQYKWSQRRDGQPEGGFPLRRERKPLASAKVGVVSCVLLLSVWLLFSRVRSHTK